MNIAIGSDHAGFERKEQIKDFLIENGFGVIDCGTFSMESCHYPVFAYSVALKVKSKEADFGVLICKTGIGSAIAANKVQGIRCGLCHNLDSARLTREHNHSNVLAMGAMFVDKELACQMTKCFLETAEEHGRHDIRVAMISEIEKGVLKDIPPAKKMT